MRVSIAARHLDMTDAMRSHVEAQLEKIRHHFDRVIDVDVVLSVEKHRHTADITLHANGVRIHGKDTSNDMYLSVDTVISKIDRQILRFKDRISRHQPRRSNVAEGPFESDTNELDMTPAARTREILREPQVVKPLTIDEAAEQLEEGNGAFLVFRNPSSEEINVIYTKRDGSFAVIEPTK